MPPHGAPEWRPATSNESGVPVTMAEATMGDTGDPISSLAVHPSTLVRLKDIYEAVENWAARHPEIARFLAADLKSSISVAERVNEQGGAAPVGASAQDAQAEPEPGSQP
jgi:hypothetical protein